MKDKNLTEKEVIANNIADKFFLERYGVQKGFKSRATLRKRTEQFRELSKRAYQEGWLDAIKNIIAFLNLNSIPFASDVENPAWKQRKELVRILSEEIENRFLRGEKK